MIRWLLTGRVHPGSRSQSSLAENYYKYDAMPMLAGSTSNECVQVSVANGLYRLGEWDIALNVLHLQDHLYIRDLQDVSSWLHNNFPKCRLDYRMNGEELTFNRMVSIGAGIWLVNLIGSRRINHVVAVDLDAQEILDGVENYPMYFSLDALEACVGDGSELQHIYVRRLRRRDEGLKRSRSKPRIRNKKKRGQSSSHVEAPDSD